MIQGVAQDFTSLSLNTPKRFWKKVRIKCIPGLFHRIRTIKTFPESYINFKIIKTAEGYTRGVFLREIKGSKIGLGKEKKRWLY